MRHDKGNASLNPHAMGCWPSYFKSNCLMLGMKKPEQVTIPHAMDHVPTDVFLPPLASPQKQICF